MATKTTTAPTPELTAEQIATERARLQIPEGGDALRSWLRWQLQQRTNPKTGKKWTQADVARAAFTSESSVSIVFQGQRLDGPKGEKIRLVTADALGIDVRILFPKPTNGNG
jgi:hypothetical protein